jgi:filamentous hemagglutinin family protein
MKAASLNHIYRLVWSRFQQAWVAVAETARAQGKSSVSGRVVEPASVSTALRHVGVITGSAKRGLLVASVLAAGTTSFASYADTNVVAGVVAGDMTVKDLSDTHTQYTHTANVNIVDFYKFGVQKGHQLDVVMPDTARTLYRVIGDSRSEIMGTLNANGSLFLINQNGILFGNGSEVNVGNIVASSLDISNDDFIKGKYNFAVGSIVGNVENYGVIKAKNEGYIVLLGKTVDNSGTLVASNGSVVLGSAQQATLDFFGNGLVKTKLSGGALEATIKNSGAIYADGGFVQMATNARASAINISGIVEANQLIERNGVIRLEGGDNAKVEVSGRLIAKGTNTTGGSIEVTGEQVALMNGAVLDASGDKGGGKVLVGGDYQGKNDAVYNARTTYIANGATIKADAIQEGNGGKVVVWADDLTRYYGDISAQGGAKNGNGGFVEVSGKQHLAMLGDVNVGAANGIGGTVLFDPENIVLNNTAASAPANQPNGTPDDAFANNPGANTEVNVTQVKGYSELYLQANNNITVNSALTMNRDGSVRLEANNDINVNAAITTTGKGSINLKADADNSGTGNLAIGANISGTGGVTLSAATLTHTAGDISAPGAGSSAGNAGNVNITVAGLADLGSANISAKGRENSFPPAGFNGGTVTINAGSLNMTGSIDTSGSSVVVPPQQTVALPGGNGGSVTISTTGNAIVGNITTGAGGAGAGNNIAASNSGTVQISSANGNLSVGNISTQGVSNSNGANVTLAANNGSVASGNINTNASSPGNNNGTNAGNIAVNAGTGINVGNINASGATGKGQSGNAGAVSLVSTNGNVDIKEVSVKVGLAIAGGSVGQTQDVFVRAGQNVTQSGSISTNSAALNTTIVAGNAYTNTGNFDISTGANGRWLIYSTSPDINQTGTQIAGGANFQQFGTSYDGVQSGAQQLNSVGNGLIYTATLPATPTTPTSPTTTTLNISPRDNAGLGGLVGTNPALNTMTIVSLNPAAGDDEDPDAVACPVNEDHLGSTPILSSGVKLPDGVNSNCI